ncbi:MAG: hypothetical protein HKN48_07045 [Flavobacteriaceae bacterium]|nr:hypothetical protein [Flavobacteriaceae bacterium]
MKKIVITSLMVLFGLGINAQTCSKYYPFTEGAVSQLTMYNKKGKMQGMVEYSVEEVGSNGNGETAKMSHKLIDEKGNLISTSSYDVLCSNGIVSMDFRSLSRPEMMKQFGEDAEVSVTGTNIDFPNDLSVGQELPDGGINVKINFSGMNMNMKTSIVDRKVVGKESVTTPAGTFECYVITSTTVMKMGTNMRNDTKQWIAEGVGVVKVEDYNKSGKVRGMSLLTSFTK